MLDLAGNGRLATLDNIYVDLTRPTVTITATPITADASGPMTVVIDAQDVLSGVESLTYSALGARTSRR